jgi:hypothetical protein
MVGSYVVAPTPNVLIDRRTLTPAPVTLSLHMPVELRAGYVDPLAGLP